VLRALIAHAILGEPTAERSVGSVELYPHQRAAVAAVRESVARLGGALLADAVGLGKTYVALAVAAGYERALIVAPAVLGEQWLAAAARARVEVEFTSIESLSRNEPAATGAFIVVDEAHHFRNKATKRYATLARLTATVPTLLLSGTPVHNRRQDLVAQLALFLGARADSLDPAEIACCVIRREHADVPSLRLPAVRRVRRIPIPADPAIGTAIATLPPPVAARDGSPAAAIIRAGLVHMWSSSEAALLAGVRRRIARGLALRESLLAGRHPSGHELAAWITDSETLQLGFPELLVEGVAEPGEHLALLDAHLDALRALRLTTVSGARGDAARVSLLRDLRARHAGERIVAFSAYAETVAFLSRALLHDGRVAAVTGGGGMIASGALSATEALAMFRAPRSARERIDLLLVTDMLSEGLNLQEASVVVHLDLPWTPARLEQRVGRVRRLGAAAPCITTYRLTLPPDVERMTRKEVVLLRKLRAANEIFGRPTTAGGVGRRVTSAALAARDLRRDAGNRAAACVSQSPPPGMTFVAAVQSHRPGCVAVLRARAQMRVAAWDGENDSAASRDPRLIHAVLTDAGGQSVCVPSSAYRRARRAIERLLRSERIDALTLDGSPPPFVRKLIARFNALVAAAPLQVRSATAIRVSELRAILARRLTAGIERELRSVESTADASSLLDECEAILKPVSRAPAAAEATHVVCLLLLVPATTANGNVTPATSGETPAHAGAVRTRQG
jgi:superfamily II DNA or RNA helicase